MIYAIFIAIACLLIAAQLDPGWLQLLIGVVALFAFRVAHEIYDALVKRVEYLESLVKDEEDILYDESID